MGLFSNILGGIADSALIGIACVTADIEFALSSMGISRNRSTSNPTVPQADSIFFAQNELNQVKESILPHTDSIETQLIANRVNFYTAPFEQWLSGDALSSIKEGFTASIRNTHDGAFAQLINTQLASDNEDCQKVFSIPSEAERKDAIRAYRAIIEKRSCEQFTMLCDDVITDLLPQLLAAAEQALSDKRCECNQRDLDREKLLVTRAKLTMIEDYLNSKA